MSIAEMNREDALYGRAMDQAPTSAPGAKHNKERKMSDDKNTQLARREPQQVSMAARYEPQNFDELARLSKAVVTSGLAPNSVRKPEDAMVILMTGAELGLRPMQSLRSIHVVKGKPVLSADLMKAVVEASGLCERWDYEETSSKRCRLTVHRAGRKPMTVEWTMEDAKRAQLLSNDNWRKYPAQMLRHRADSDAARAAFPDLLMGLYTPDEIAPGQGEPVDLGNAKATPQPAAQDDAIDAEFEEAAAEPEPHHWSEVPVDAGDDFSGDDTWTRASNLFHGLFTGDCADLKEMFHEFVKARHGAERFHNIAPALLDRWNNAIAKRDITPKGAGEMSERAEWLTEKIEQWQGSQEAA